MDINVSRAKERWLDEPQTVSDMAANDRA